MLEGLGITDARLLVASANKDFRADADFWIKEPKLNPNLKYDKIGNCLVSAQYGVSIAMNEDGDGYPIYRMNEIHDMLCDFVVSKSADLSKKELGIFNLNDGDVLFNRTNSFEWVGRTGLYKKVGAREFVFASYLVRFVPNRKIILPEYLTAFLNSKQGVWDIKRRARQSINQTNVNPEEVKQIDIPILDMKIQGLIKRCFDKAVLNLQASHLLYTKAETLLLQELGLSDWQPTIKNNNTKTLKESFLESGRIDAEYYQPKYDELLEVICQYKNGWGRVDESCTIKNKNFQPKENSVYKYIELSNIGSNGIIFDLAEYEGTELPSRARRLVKTNDVIISSIQGSLSSCAIIPEHVDNAVCSTGFYVIKSDKINSETLLILFKSVLIYLMTKGCSGTILTAINNDEFSKIPIPNIEISTQRLIAQKIQESFRLQKQSKDLLEAAKTAVEIAIEQDEQTALNYLQNFKDAIIHPAQI